MTITEYSTLTWSQPSRWASEATREVSETMTRYPILRLERREIELNVSVLLKNQPWFRTIRDRLQEYLSFKENWNGYGESPIQEGAVKRAVAVLDAIIFKETPRPDVVPTSEGGIQIEWTYNGFEIEIEVLPTGPAQIFIVEPSGQEYEWSASPTSQAWGKLQDCIAKMSCEFID